MSEKKVSKITEYKERYVRCNHDSWDLQNDVYRVDLHAPEDEPQLSEIGDDTDRPMAVKASLPALVIHYPGCLDPGDLITV